jgi:copper chaperone CopZ
MVVRVTISRIEGVKSVEPNPITQSCKVVYDDTKTNPEAFVKALAKEGQQVLGQPKFIE